MNRKLALGLVSVVLTQNAYGDALDECWETSKNRIELGECLRNERERVDNELESAFAKAMVSQEALDSTVGLRRASRTLERAQMAFELYRNLECHSRELQAGAGTGSGDFFLGCWVDLSAQRTRDLLTLAGSAPGAGASPVTPSELEGSSWLAEDIAGHAVLDNVRSTLRFESATRVSGNAACNGYHGAVVAGENGLSFGPFASTRKMCPPPIIDQERRYLEALGSARRMERRGDLLFLYGDAPEPLLRLSKLEPAQTG